MANSIFENAFFRKVAYYFLSLSFIKEVENWPVVFLNYFGILPPQSKCLILRNGLRFNFRDYFDTWVIKEVCIDRGYLLFDKPQKGDVVIDIGAHIGAFSVLAASFDKSIKVYSFEPNPESYDYLNRNIKINKLKNVRTFKVGISDEKGKRKLYNLLAPGLNSFFKVRTPLGFTEVECVTLEDVFVQNKIKKCDFLKMDCEGAEYEILFNLPKRFIKKIKKIALEYHDGYNQRNHEDLADLLEQNGFEVKVTPHRLEENIGHIYAREKNRHQKHLSVIIPAKDNFQYLSKAINSVLNQNFPCQVVVVDDGSSPSLLPFLRRKFPQILAFRNKVSKGPAAARNQGLKHVKGDYISFLDSDDFWKPNFAQIMVAACKESGGAAICFSSKIFSQQFGFKRKVIFKLLSSFKDSALIFMLLFNQRILLKSGFYLAQISHLVFGRKAIRGILFDESYKFGEDWKFIIRVQKKTKIKIVPKELLYFRFHDKSFSFKNKEKWLFYRQLLKELTPSVKRGLLVRFFSFYISLFSKLD